MTTILSWLYINMLASLGNKKRPTYLLFTIWLLFKLDIIHYLAKVIFIDYNNFVTLLIIFFQTRLNCRTVQKRTEKWKSHKLRMHSKNHIVVAKK